MPLTRQISREVARGSSSRQCLLVCNVLYLAPHKAVGAALTLALILGGLGIGISSSEPEALDILDIVPRATQKFSIALRGNPRRVVKLLAAPSLGSRLLCERGSSRARSALWPCRLGWVFVGEM